MSGSSLYAFIAEENGQLIAVLDYAYDPSKNLEAVQDRAVKPAVAREGELVSLARYCNEHGLTLSYRELPPYDSENPHYEKRAWYGAALCAGINPKFYYRENIARDLIQRVNSGRLTMRFPEWPKDLYPTAPFSNPFYEHYTVGASSQSMTPERIDRNLAFYLSYLLDHPVPVTHLANRDTNDRNLFHPLPHLGNAVTAMERRGTITRIGDEWIETDISNRRIALLLLACKFPDLEFDGVPEDSLPPYSHSGIGITIYENRGRPLLVEEWQAALRSAANEIVKCPTIDQGPETPPQWMATVDAKLRKLLL